MLYSTGHHPAEVIGRYEQDPDNRISVFMLGLNAGSQETHLFTVDQHRLGFAKAYTPGGVGSYFLLRAFPFGPSEEAIASQEAKSTEMTDGMIVSRYYDQDLRLLRTETKTIPKQQIR